MPTQAAHALTGEALTSCAAMLHSARMSGVKRGALEAEAWPELLDAWASGS